MKLIVITRCSTNWRTGLSHLVNSLHNFGYDFKVIIDPNTRADMNGPKTHAEWLKKNRKDYTHVLHTDGFDTIALGSVEELCEKYIRVAEDKWLHSAEKNCFPTKENCELIKYVPSDFPEVTPWRFTNGGGYMAPVDLFLDIVNKTPRRDDTKGEVNENDNEWGNNLYLYHNNNEVRIDSQCEIFQSLYMEAAGDFYWNGNRLHNNITNTNPIFAHGNGASNIQAVYENLGLK